MICPNCGTENPDDYILCHNCRTALGHGATSISADPARADATAPVDASAHARPLFCGNCGTPTEPSAAFCGNCGAALQPQAVTQSKSDVQPPTPAQSQAVPQYQAPPSLPGAVRAVRSRSNSPALLFIVIAVLAGVGIGGFLIYRIYKESTDKTQATKTLPTSTPVATNQPSSQAPQSPASSENTPASGVAGSNSEQSSETATEPTRARALQKSGTQSASSRRSRREQIASEQRASERSIAVPDQQPQVQVPASPPQTVQPSATSETRRAAKASDGGNTVSPSSSSEPRSAPVGSQSAAASAPASAQNPSASQSQAEPASSASTQRAAASPQTVPAPQIPAKPAYNGPVSGVVVWTGKLDKNQTLTIADGMPSVGVLSGAPLPGVPVRLSIAESNLGFAEMPSAANGYRRLILRSHSKHSNITIRWTVVQ